MTRLPALALPLLLLALPARAAPPTLASAEALVRAQYTAEANPPPDAAARLYAPEIGQEMMDPIRGAGAALGLDPRYGQDEARVSDLKVSAAAGPGGRARVTARFLITGKAVEIDWTLIPAQGAPSGWRVYDISGPEEGDRPAFDLRQLLNLQK